jgi:chromosome transmission fidelity protein 1
VVGAKLSEGLNFSDDLARAVVIVGLPFANMGSVELKERMRYVAEVERKAASISGENTSRDAGMELYENLCMKAVNQSIGKSW